MTTFGSPTEENFYTLNRVGLSIGTFYDLEGDYLFERDAAFFPEVRTSLLSAEIEYFDELISYDALAVAIGASPENSRAMRALYRAPFPGHEDWLKELTNLYDVVLVTGGDAAYVEAWTRDPDKFSMLDNAIEVVESAIMASSWYRQNEPELIWDGRSGLCYVLPASLDF